ncbi:LSU ribosomal protein L25P [Balneicella halophila]|uniref:Large ribosomal subunit protein bL25 n=1 Tax=Balneicella halophila TaxID=1537566 RepID=A0A7L4URG1_BALHA|nr:50S ribosomal protein L25/general stress protein Ctc [Balneicella halophila]PVX52249.1 LSU ribosomal protein L25P [Balneicella halophila]
MKTFDLAGESRETTGKKAAKAFRAEGKVPCVVYGKGDNVHFVAEAKSFTKLIYTPNSYIVNLSIDGKEETAIVKDVQFHPVSDEILHVDFARVDTKNPIVIEVPVKTEGLAKGVKAGGKLHLSTRKLRVKALMENLPDVLTVNVTNLTLGKSILVEDLEFDNIELVNSPKAVVAQVKLTRAAKSADDDFDDEDEDEEESSGEGEENKEEAAE